MIIVSEQTCPGKEEGRGANCGGGRGGVGGGGGGVCADENY